MSESGVGIALLKPKEGAVNVEFLSGGGALGRLIRAYDWSRTPLGPLERWPQSLKTATAILLRSPVPIVLLWGVEGIMIYNDAYAVFGGARHPGLLGSKVLEGWPEVADFNGNVMRVGLAGGTLAYRDQHLVLHRHGRAEDVWMNLDYSPVLDEAGNPAGVLAIVVETTDRVVGERRLRTLREIGSRTTPARSVETVCDAALAAMAEENPADLPAALLYLFSAEELRLAAHYGAEPRQHVLSPDLSGGTEIAAAIAALRRGESGEVPARLLLGETVGRLVRFDLLPITAGAAMVGALAIGREQGVSVIGANVKDAGGRATGSPDALRLRHFLELVASQVSKAIAAAQTLEGERRRAESLAELDRAKTSFFSNISHEFRTPLTLMLGPLAEISADPALADGARAQLALAQRNSLRLLKLVNSLLDFSRLEAGRTQASFEPTDLAALTRDLASTFRSTIERSGLEFAVTCAPLAEPVYVDREMWEKIVLNLLSNAFKFTLAGRIAVDLRQEGAHAVLEVTDTGAGMPESELPRIFERFHRIEVVAARTQEGSGIGLAIVQELVKLHGGEVSVQSRPGSGSTFQVRLPLGAAHLPAGQIRAPGLTVSRSVGSYAYLEEAQRWLADERRERDDSIPSAEWQLPRGRADASARAGPSRRVLVADDNADMRAYLGDLLSPTYRVETVSNGEQALEAVEREPPALVLADVMMPRCNGLQLLDRLRAEERTREIPIVLLSARAGEEARVEGLHAGADDYLVKPFSGRELLARIGTLLELTRMRAERAAQFRAFVGATSDAVFRMSADWSEMRHLEGNRFIADTKEPARDWIERYIPPSDQPQVRRAIEKMLRIRRCPSLEHRVLRLDGSLGWALSRAVPIEDANGAITEWFGTTSDISERKLAEAQIARAEEQLRHEARQKDEFLAMLAHELRNPLAPITNASELLLHTLTEKGRARTAIEMIRRQALHLTRLVDDLLDVSRITQGRIQLQRAPVNIAQVIAQAVETAEPLLRQKRLRLSSTTSSYELYVEGDLARLIQSVVNVLGNAVKYTDAPGEIRIQTRAEGDRAVIEVSDNGAGIAPELLPRIFDLFVQGDRTLDRAEGGLGIGLCVVKRLIEMHAGEIIAESPGIGLGATFQIRLPRIGRPQPQLLESPQTDAPPKRILVVDDNSDAAEALAVLLGLQGHETRAALSGREALEAAETFRPEVALLDLGLPGMDGYELAARLRAMPQLRGIRLVALTGYGRSEDRLRTQGAGFDDHLVKPVELAALARTLRPFR
ncbi:MAG TPA: ATP-binding protein [Steroidobacteraceae bacterium]|nr:ATP-binding protein [Steroidobacteraceae bacterium]